MIDATPLQNEHARRGIGTYVRGLITGLEARDLTNWGVLAYPGPLPVRGQRPRVAPVLPRKPGLLEFHGGWVLDELLLPRRLSGTELFHATDPRRVPAPSKVRVVATVYDLTPLQDREVWRSLWPDQRLAFRRAAANARRASAIVAISRVAAADVVDRLGVPQSKVHVVYPSVAPSTGRQGAREPDHLLFVGAPDPHKNLDLLLRALAAMPTTTRPLLTVVGPWSRQATERTRAFAHAIGLERISVEADAPAERLDALYRSVTALVVPSRREGFGLPLLEAMARGCPVVAADLPVLREVAGGAVLHVSANSAPELCAGLVEVLTNEDRRTELAAAGLRRAAAFNPGQATDALLACYRSLGFDLSA